MRDTPARNDIPFRAREMSKKKPKKSLKAFRKFLVRRKPGAPHVEPKSLRAKRKKPKAKSVKTGKGVKAVKGKTPPGKTPPVRSVLATPLQGTLRAASFAARKHMGQKRADGITPYFSHVARVAFVLSHVFGVHDEELISAAFLHDTLEDTATDYDEIAENFGEEVADIVVLLTKNNMLPKRVREREYEMRLIAAPERVKIAKMADLYDNLSDRVTSTKILKTTQTAERLLRAFGPLLLTREGTGAHARTAQLLVQIRLAQPDTTGGPHMAL